MSFLVSPINAFDFIFGIPYAITIGVQRAWTYCPANSTNATAYEVSMNAKNYRLLKNGFKLTVAHSVTGVIFLI